LKVAHYEAVGRFFSKATRPASARDEAGLLCFVCPSVPATQTIAFDTSTNAIAATVGLFLNLDNKFRFIVLFFSTVL
jgi:hypothetical protein